MAMEFLCPPACAIGGFRVPATYFLDHPAFAPGICPKCGKVPDVVEARTNRVIPGAQIDDRGRIVLPHIQAREAE